MSEAGIVVHIIARICENIFTFVTNAAKLVVSDSGDILSPKTAPAMMAPAAIPKFIFNWLAMEISAIPAVDADPQAVPVAKLQMAEIINADTKKY